MASNADPPPTPSAYRRYRAPNDDNRSLVDPPLGELPALAASNREAVAANAFDAHGWRLNEWSAAARRRLIELASDYTRSFCDVPSETGAGPLFLSGHQPELFHPGVWFKNRVLDRLASQTGGVGVHLLIDSDLCRSTSLRVPRGPIDKPRWESFAYDTTTDPQPYEERPVVDRARFDSFAARVREGLDDLIDNPLVTDLWPDAVAAAGRGATLGESLSIARRLVEQRWGAATLELPLSRLIDTRELRWAIAMVMADAARVRDAYNAALAAYRTAHKLRSPAQPLPDLATDGAAVETPLWVWTEDDPTRRPLFVEPTAGGWRLLDRRGGEWRIDAPSDGPLEGQINDAVDQLAELRERGVKIRPRALVTTLFSRLLLGDLFLHGIGGAKYDQVTDDFCHRWLGSAPPPHATVTATLRLPIDHPSVDESDETTLRVRLRELEFHPERFTTLPEAAALVAAKRDAVAAPGRSLARHQAIVAANNALLPFVTEQRRAAERELAAVRGQLSAAAVLDSREHAFCLYPEADLRERFDRLLSDPR